MRRLLCILFFCCCLLGLSAQPVFERDDTITDSLQANQWLTQASIAYSKENPTTSLRFLLQAIEYLEKSDSPNRLLEAYQKTGRIYLEEKLFAKALEYFNRANVLPIKTEQENELWNQLAYTHAQLEQVDSALHFYEKLLLRHSQANDQVAMIRVYQDMVSVLSVAGKHEEALAHNLSILRLIEPLGRPRELAVIYNNIGYNYSALQQYLQAREYFKSAVEMAEGTDWIDFAAVYSNMGIASQNNGQIKEAIHYFQKSINRLGKNQQEKSVQIRNLIAETYLNENDLYNALRHNEDALGEATKPYLPVPLSEAYLTAAHIHEKLYDYELALDFYQKHLSLRDSLLFEERLRQQALLQQQFLLERAEKEIKLLLVDQQVKDLSIEQLRLANEKSMVEMSNQKLLVQTREDELALARQNEEVERARAVNQELEAKRAQQELALVEQQLTAQIKDRRIADLQQQEQEQQLALAEQEQALLKKEMAEQENQMKIVELERRQRIDQLELEREQSVRKSFYGLLALLSLITIMILAGLIYFRKANSVLEKKNDQIEEQKIQIEEQRNQSERLLLNILPSDTAQELKTKGMATPRQYDLVTVVFTDFNGFTNISAGMTPDELIEELNTCFMAFDDIIEQNNLEKIKTIGDAYMCAGGIPKPNTTNPVDAVRAALQMKKFMDERGKQKAINNKVYWQMRVGIHSGRVIAGVVGKRKFAYDIWGDTVNTASRMETTGTPGRINISEHTYQLVKDHFKCTFRGEEEVRHIGKIKMYYVEEELQVV